MFTMSVQPWTSRKCRVQRMLPDLSWTPMISVSVELFVFSFCLLEELATRGIFCSWGFNDPLQDFSTHMLATFYKDCLCLTSRTMASVNTVVLVWHPIPTYRVLQWRKQQPMVLVFFLCLRTGCVTPRQPWDNGGRHGWEVSLAAHFVSLLCVVLPGWFHVVLAENSQIGAINDKII